MPSPSDRIGDDRLREILAGCKVQHVFSPGSRCHVTSYALYEGSDGTAAIGWCSELFCQRNRLAFQRLHDIGLNAIEKSPFPGRPELSRPTKEPAHGK